MFVDNNTGGCRCNRSLALPKEAPITNDKQHCTRYTETGVILFAFCTNSGNQFIVYTGCEQLELGVTRRDRAADIPRCSNCKLGGTASGIRIENGKSCYGGTYEPRGVMKRQD